MACLTTGAGLLAIRADSVLLYLASAGVNDFGQFGVGNRADSTVPKLAAGGRTFAALSAGPSHTCGLDKDSGRAACWGKGTVLPGLSKRAKPVLTYMLSHLPLVVQETIILASWVQARTTKDRLPHQLR